MGKKYIIQDGDTLTKIAEDNGVSIEDIASANNITNVNRIYSGDILDIPDGATNNNTTTNSLSKYDGGFQGTQAITDATQKKTDADAAYTDYVNKGFSYDQDATYNDIINKILNREKFSYDLNGDALYQQYKDKYIQQGKMAMQDTMGQAAAMTGGYGNSYAASVGNQAYQAQLNNLNDVIPELYQMAYDKYNQEGQDMYNQYSMLSDDRNTKYGMWADTANRLDSDRSYYTNEANNVYVRDHGEWSDQRDFDTNQYWKEAEFAEAQRQFNEQQSMAREQWEWTKNNSSSGSSGSSGGGSSSGSGSGSGSGAGSGGDTTSTAASVPKEVVDALKEAKTNRRKAEILEGFAAQYDWNEDQVGEIMAEYGNITPDLKDRTWTKTGKDSFNWGWGVDNNDKVKDQYGNVYRLDDLVDALVDEGMTKKAAKEFVKKYN